MRNSLIILKVILLIIGTTILIVNSINKFEYDISSTNVSYKVEFFYIGIVGIVFLFLAAIINIPDKKE